MDLVLGNIVNKIICQTYDGSSVMSGKYLDAQAKIQEKYHYAWFFHCHAHQVNLKVVKSCNCSKVDRIFFFNEEGLTNFF